MITYFEELLRILEKSLESVDEQMFFDLVSQSTEVLGNGGKIIVSGLGKNVPVCEKFVGTLTSLGLKASYMNTDSAVHGDLGMVCDEDLVLLLTKSGETIESVHLYNLLKQRGCRIWLLSFEQRSTLADAIDTKIILDLEHEGDAWNLVPNNSTTVNLIVLQMLAMRIADAMDIKLDTFRRNHPGGHIGEILNA